MSHTTSQFVSIATRDRGNTIIHLYKMVYPYSGVGTNFESL